MTTKKKVKKKKEGRLNGHYKDAMVEQLVRECVRLTPTLTRVQVQRIFSHAYQTVRRDKRGKMFDVARKARIVGVLDAGN